MPGSVANVPVMTRWFCVVPCCTIAQGWLVRQAVLDEAYRRAFRGRAAPCKPRWSGGARQRVPVEVHAAVFQVAGHEDAGLRMVAVRQRNARVGGKRRKPP